MDSKPFSTLFNSSLHLRCRASLFRPLCLAQANPRFHFFRFSSLSCCSSSPSSRLSPLLCSLSESGRANALPNAACEAVTEVAQNRLLQVVLVSPQIPGNTGCIARSCAASAVGLHLVEPLGFQVDDTKLKRAGLDYWPYVVVKVHGSWAEFRDYFKKQAGEKRLLAFTKRGKAIHSRNVWNNSFLPFKSSTLTVSGMNTAGFLLPAPGLEFSYRRGDWLVFGSETSGLPPEALRDCESEPLGGGTIRIPMVETYVRCLNLSVSVGIALYEASRQLNYEQLHYTPEASMPTEKSFLIEDIFA